MKVLSRQIKLDSYEYKRRHLMIINPMLPDKIFMTNKEIEVLASFMSIKGELKSNPFCKEGRKIVMNRLKISDAGLCNYLRQLKEKGLIIDKAGIYSILNVLIPEEESQEYNFKIIQNFNEE